MTVNSKALKAAWDVVNDPTAVEPPEGNLGLAIAAYLDEAGIPIRWCTQHVRVEALCVRTVDQNCIGSTLDAVLVIEGNE